MVAASDCSLFLPGSQEPTFFLWKQLWGRPRWAQPLRALPPGKRPGQWGRAEGGDTWCSQQISQSKPGQQGSAHGAWSPPQTTTLPSFFSFDSSFLIYCLAVNKYGKFQTFKSKNIQRTPKYLSPSFNNYLLIANLILYILPSMFLPPDYLEINPRYHIIVFL